ncbi:MAG: tripartite tricarboxylate transporter substrate-binding protein [Beijerinckiaceae bacterium]|nr:tripartite tricarboxylate transporter substrate-binding protein [Beijerinckiaceae bacterium]
MKRILLSATAIGAFVSITGGALAQQDFYKDKQISMLVASGVGGGYDVYARALGRHMPRFIPGAPVFVARNMPTAGGLTAANTLFNTSDRDGSVIAALTNGVPMDPLFGVKEAKFDGRKFSWIGSMGKLQNVCATWHQSPIKTVEDARNREVVVGASGVTSNSSVMPRIANEVLATKFKVITGYDPSSGLNMALESGEVEGICGLGWSTLTASRPDWVRDNKLNVLVQFGFEKLPDLPNVPSALDLITDPEKRAILELILVRQETGRPIVGPPGMPADRLTILRSAFDATMKDAEFLTEAKKLQLDIDPLNASAVEKLLAKAYDSPRNVVEAAARLVVPPPR